MVLRDKHHLPLKCLRSYITRDESENFRKVAPDKTILGKDNIENKILGLFARQALMRFNPSLGTVATNTRTRSGPRHHKGETQKQITRY